MNTAQRRFIIARDGFRSAFSGRGYKDESYFELERQVKAARKLAEKGEGPPDSTLLLEVDHLEVGRPEAPHQVQTLAEDEHWQKDNSSRDGQIQFVKRLLAKESATAVRTLLLERLEQLEGGMNMADIGRAYASRFKGKVPKAYAAAWKREREVDGPARKAARKASARASRKGTRARLLRATKRASAGRFGGRKETSATRTSGLRLPSKTLEQMSRPVLNGRGARD